jgi:Tol biopolymer transport system component/beta-lactamase regulating signal transducer with metallopeptidase domain
MNVIAVEMSPFLGWLLKTTLQGSVLIGLILVIKWVLRGKLAARWQYALWLLLLVRLAAPWMPQSRFSLSHLMMRWVPRDNSPVTMNDRVIETTVVESPHPAATSKTQTVMVSAPGQTSSVPAARDIPVTVTPLPEAPEPPIAAGHGDAPNRLGGLVVMWPWFWLAGAVGLGGYIGARNLRLWLMVTAERQLVDQAVLELLEDCKQQMQINTPVSVVITDRVGSPALFGFIRPRILLPQGLLEMVSLDELQYVFLHELAHLKRGDIYARWLTAVLQILHWFNPLIWLGFRTMHADQETACDALAMSCMASEETSQYGRTLVRLLEQFSQPQYLPSVAGILEDKSRLERRISMITQFKSSSYGWSPMAVLLIGVLACVILPDAPHLKAADVPAPRIALRQVWTGPDVDTYGGPSSDGRHLSYVDWETGDLAIRELATGKTQRLTKKGGWDPPRAFALNSIISPDNKCVAYAWFNQHGTYDLCLIGVDGTGDQTLCSSKDYEVYPVAWSSDGRQIVARKYTKAGDFEIILVSVDDGSTKALKNFAKHRFWARLCYSPDDQFVAYDFPVAKDQGNHDISLLSVDGNNEIPLIRHPASDRLLGWVPQREEVLFLSDRAGTQDIWAMRVVNGRPQGSPRRIKSAIGDISPMGFARNGSFYFNLHSGFSTVYTTRLDMKTGEILDPLSQPFIGSMFFPEWSPDGKSLAYLSRESNPVDFDMILHIRSLTTGQDHEVSCQLNRLCNPRWSPDGHSVLVTAFDQNNERKDYWGGLYKIDVKDEQVTALVEYATGTLGTGQWSRIIGAWSPDGKAIFYINRDSVLKKELESGHETQLYSNPHLMTNKAGFRLIDISPDGNHVLFGIQDPENSSAALMVMSASGGEVLELIKLTASDEIEALAWAPSGRHIVFTKKEKEGISLWRIAAQGGDAQRLWESDKDLRSLRIHPDGQRIAFYETTKNAEIWALENFLPQSISVTEPVATPTLRKIQMPTEVPGSMKLSPDGKHISLASDKKLWIMPAAGQLGPDIPGEPVALDTGGVLVGGSDHVWSADGKWIAFNEELSVNNDKEKGNQGIYVIQAKGGTPKKVHVAYRDQRTVNYRISLSPHGQTLAFSAVDAEMKEQYIYTIEVDGGKPKRLVDMQAREPVFSPDGTRIAFVEDRDMGRNGGGLWVVSAQGGQPKQVADAASASSPVWSPGGDMIAFLDVGAKEKQINIIRISQEENVIGESIQLDAPEGTDIWCLSGWSPDNHIGAIFDRPGESGLYTVSAQGGKAMQVAYGGGQPRWSPDGKRIFCLTKPQGDDTAWKAQAVSWFPGEGGPVITLPLRSDTPIRPPYFGAGNRVSPNGETLVFSGRATGKPPQFMHNQVWTVPVAGGQPRSMTDFAENTSDMYPCWSPDGTRIAYVHARFPDKMTTVSDIKADIYILKKEGGKATALTAESDGVNFGPIAWSPDGKDIAFYTQVDEHDVTGLLKLFSINGENESRIIGTVSQVHPGREFAWSPDGRKIAFGGSDRKTISIMSVTDGSSITIQTGLSDVNVGPQLDWSPDGKRFVFTGGRGEASEFWMIEDFLPAANASMDK